MYRQATAFQQEMAPRILETLVASNLLNSRLPKTDTLVNTQDKQQLGHDTSGRLLIQNKAWMNFIFIAMITFRRELKSHFATIK